MRFAERTAKLPPYFFADMRGRISAKRAGGQDVISFAVGDPDLPTPAPVLARLLEAARDPMNHRYPGGDGLRELREAACRWYRRRFGVVLDADREVVPLIGTKEGIAHAALCLIDPGDLALVPDPGYQTYAEGVMIAGGDCHSMPLREGNGWLPDLDQIPAEAARRAKLMWLNYPNNPTAAIAPLTYFADVVAFARRHDLAVLHDAAYADVVYDGHRPLSFLQAPESMEVGMEFYSLSKTYNMAGWRIGFAVGNADLVQALSSMKSHLDSGIPRAIQHAAVEALAGSPDTIDARNAIYQRRRDRLVAALRGLGFEVTPPPATLYVWLRVPAGYTSVEFTHRLLDECNLATTPGTSYGNHGEGYIRLSLTVSDDQIDEGIRRLERWPCLTR